jgi:hypothetical protein
VVLSGVLLPRNFLFGIRAVKSPDYLDFDEAIAIVADVYLRALDVPTALVLGGQ